MVLVEDLLTDSLSACVGSWFETPFTHPFLELKTVSVADAVRPIPKRWVDDIEIDEGFGAEEGDLLGEGPVRSWSMDEGKQRLRDSLARLNLPEDRVSHANLPKMNRHELASEKRRVKQELKRYDADFRKQFSRLPTHSEKEPMRPLYVYYRRLKTMIAQAETSKLGPRESVTTGPDEETPRQGGRRPNVEDQIAALEARIDSLQTEKGSVRVKLQAFQEKFVSENNRKIRFHKDILPIEREYRMYKNLKEEIQKAETQLRDLREDA
uniref:FAM13A-like domain-containing protein n=1 Tax=Alexandrium monilatum TaxID=311494 RepID=A0A7S4V045_9DINO|mmetsp:Transcript_82602/g.246335  ORF Transcript_82602/g.246335 Transcript_82602/m.246335 type:complete len:267 (+) Transcript_82602:103-903(+)